MNLHITHHLNSSVIYKKKYCGWEHEYSEINIGSEYSF